MLVKEAIEHYGSVTKLAQALGVSRQCIYLWDEFVPDLQAYKLYVLTKGQLRIPGCDDD